MPGEKPKTTFSVADFRDAAEKFAYFSKRYGDLADLMTHRKMEGVQAGNLKTLRASVDHIVKAINRAYEGYDAELIKTGIFATPEEQVAATILAQSPEPGEKPGDKPGDGTKRRRKKRPRN